MAGIWCMLVYRRKIWDRLRSYQEVFHVHFPADNGLANHFLYFHRILDECEELYTQRKAQPSQKSLITLRPL